MWLAEAAASAMGLGCGRVACPQAGEAGAGALRAGGEEDPLVRPPRCWGSQGQLRDDEVIKDSGPSRPSGASPARVPRPPKLRPRAPLLAYICDELFTPSSPSIMSLSSLCLSPPHPAPGTSHTAAAVLGVSDLTVSVETSLRPPAPRQQPTPPRPCPAPPGQVQISKGVQSPRGFLPPRGG